MIDSNLTLLREQEQARVNLFMNNKQPKDSHEKSLVVENQQDVVDQALMDILNLAKEDCENLADNRIVACFFEGSEMRRR
jgi:hypothetical protein